MKEETKNAIKTYAVAIAIPLATGVLSAFVTRGSMQIYKTLKAPPLSPPPFLFPIVWMALFTLMGISSALVWLNRHKNPKAARSGFLVYGISLVLNFLWSIIFFNMRQFLIAFVILLLLLYFILQTIKEYKKVSPAAAYLQIPYALWVAFAGYLNIAIWFLNR